MIFIQDYFLMIFLLAFGTIGAIDEFFYHNLKFNLLERSQSYIENLLHTVRLLLYAFIYFFIANVELYGNFVFILAMLMILDIIVGYGDIIVEKESRKDLGGLPTGEYLLHMSLSGALGAFYLLLSYKLYLNFSEQSKIIFKEYSSPFVQSALSLYAFLALALFILYSFKLRKSGRN